MQFSPQANDRISIDSVDYTFTEHPGLPTGSGFPYGQEGRAATVYQICGQVGKPKALKVLKPFYQKASLAGQAELLAPFAQLQGLAVCERTVFTEQSHRQLLRQFPGLQFSVLMPWISGLTWFEIVLQRRPLTHDQSHALAERFLEDMVGLESHQVAHGDLAGGNLIVDGLDSASVQVELVDLEQLYEPSLPRPVAVMGGSPGYAHHRSGDGLWQVDMDRFAGAILVSEMLGWCDPQVVDGASDEAYFDQQELQEESARYQLMRRSLEANWSPSIGELLERARRSEQLSECPTFEEWRAAICGGESVEVTSPTPDVVAIIKTPDSGVNGREVAVPPESPLVGWEPIETALSGNLAEQEQVDESSGPVDSADAQASSSQVTAESADRSPREIDSLIEENKTANAAPTGIRGWLKRAGEKLTGEWEA